MTIKNAIACLILLTNTAYAQQKPLVVDADHIIAPIQPTMWGVFFEDINFGADGGLYAELVKNRSFEYTKPLMGWKTGGAKFTEGCMLILKGDNPKNPHYLRVTADHAGKGDLWLTNEGFRGMGVKQGVRYTFSVMTSHSQGIRLAVELVDPQG